MARRTTLTALALVMAFVVQAIGLSPARASGPAKFYAVVTSQTLVGTCTEGYLGASQCNYLLTGYALRSDHTLFDLTIYKQVNTPRACSIPDFSGTWTLQEHNGGDALSGTMPGQVFWPPHWLMKVDSGSGAYAGQTDAYADGKVQNFGDTTVGEGPLGVLLISVVRLVEGCTPYEDVGYPHGTLNFTLAPA